MTRERGNKPKGIADPWRIERQLRLADLPEQYLSVDPGSVHCGVGRWEHGLILDPDYDGPDGPPLHELRLVEVYERSPAALYIELREAKADGIGLVLIEDFMLQKGRNQAGSRLETVKTIGVVEYVCSQAQIRYRLQSASIKAFIDPWLAAQVPHSHGGGVDVEELASNSHKRDSIRHGLYPALRDPRDRASVRLVLDEHVRGRGAPRRDMV